MHMYKIIDFHTHIFDKEFQNEFSYKNNIQNVISIPLSFPKGYTWNQLTEISGINFKPYRFVDFLKYDLFNVNKEHYKNTSEENRKYDRDFYIFVPWISVLNDINSIKKSIWYNNTDILKFIPVFDNFYVSNSNEVIIEKYTNKINKNLSQVHQNIIMIHTGWGSSPIYFEDIIKKNSDKQIVLAHMKEDVDKDNTDRLYMLENYENVYLEMSFISSPKRLKQYINKGFGNKILFGSDCRSKDDLGTFLWMLDAIERSGIDDIQKNNILYENAKKILLNI